MKVTIATFSATFWICCSLCTHLFAQPDDFITRSYFMKDGLSFDDSFTITQDHQSFIWIGTHSGLNKFDGYRFTQYLRNPSDSNSIHCNLVHSLWPDRQHRLWVGTAEGLAVMDLTTEKFHRLFLNARDSTHSIQIEVYKFRERKDGKLWICTNNGIYLADLQTLSITTPAYLKDKVVYTRDIAEGPGGTVWISTNGVMRIDTLSGKVTHYQHNPDDPKSLANNFNLTLHIDRQERIWAGTFTHLDLFNPKDNSFTHYAPDIPLASEPYIRSC